MGQLVTSVFFLDKKGFLNDACFTRAAVYIGIVRLKISLQRLKFKKLLYLVIFERNENLTKIFEKKYFMNLFQFYRRCNRFQILDLIKFLSAKSKNVYEEKDLKLN